jgi:large subunit ribosomal protein L1
MIDREQIVSVVEKAKKDATQRRFPQSIDLEVKLRGIDATKQDTSFTEVYPLPKGLGSKRKTVCILADGNSLPRARNSGADRVMSRAELEAMAGDKKAIKKLARSYDFFVADVTLMPVVGRVMGQVLGPRNKVPTPFPSNAEPSPIVARLNTSVRVKLKGQPVIRCAIGSEEMSPQDVAENVRGVLDLVAQKVKGGAGSIDKVSIKLTMGKPSSAKSK